MFKKKSKQPEKKVSRGPAAGRGRRGSGTDAVRPFNAAAWTAPPRLTATSRRRAGFQMCWSGSRGAGRKRSGGRRDRVLTTK